MILYFSGTGNSFYVAQKLAGKEEKIISIADMLQNKEFLLELSEGEKLGIIFPVYFYTIPSIIKDFFEKVEILNTDYVYTVITCGGGTGQASAVLKKLLYKKGIKLSYFREVLMPDNSMLFYQIPSVEQAEGRLTDALKICDEIRLDVAGKKLSRIKNSTIVSNVMGKAYKLCSGTKKYYALETCTGCGLCEQNCPEQVIKIMDGKPVWEKEKCCKCSACINRCPVKAIQYGKGTLKRNRYFNPYVKSEM